MSENKHPNMFSWQMEAIVFIILQIFFFRNTRRFENWGISFRYSPVLNQSRARKIYFMDYKYHYTYRYNRFLNLAS